MSDELINERLETLTDHLTATASYPLDRATNRWLGEAEAVARDVATNDLDEATTVDRLRQIRHLLDEAGTAEHDAADNHLKAARDRCEELLKTLDN